MSPKDNMLVEEINRGTQIELSIVYLANTISSVNNEI